MSSRTIKIIIGALVVVVAVGVLVWVGVGRGSVYYYSVSELLAKGPSDQIRVSGELVQGTVQGMGTANLKFVIHDRDQAAKTMPVAFSGVVPDSFRDQADAEVVAEGSFGTDGAFTAKSLVAKCPSKYEAAK